eukprot:TRINITY_DN4553_c0_g1_i1.p1 TRINITY_DN4553_c0_g1~~TRINITY_DN4553_c0_g1_i1.p1  ORF type:complete len:135 (-),score=31.51 TRINITY_DN4553_c0_g1_i1:228-632(-)
MGDLFDDILFLEDRFVEEGEQEGMEAGLRGGRTQGLYVGHVKGIQLGKELGYYKGVLAGWTLVGAAANKERLQKKIVSLTSLVATFVFDANRPTVMEEFENIRNKFKFISKQLSFTISIPGSSPDPQTGPSLGY